MRAWLHISDAIQSINAAICKNLDKYYVINIGHPDVVTINHLANLIVSKLNADPSLVKHVDLPKRMTLSKRPTLSLQQDLLGVIPKVSLEEGVDRVIKRFTV